MILMEKNEVSSLYWLEFERTAYGNTITVGRPIVTIIIIAEFLPDQI